MSDIDRATIYTSVTFLDNFTKTFCKKRDSEHLDFWCEECPFSHDGFCMVKEFKCKYAPDYKDFGSMSDL